MPAQERRDGRLSLAFLRDEFQQWKHQCWIIRYRHNPSQ
jgi:hypothetical protein